MDFIVQVPQNLNIEQVMKGHPCNGLPHIKHNAEILNWLCGLVTAQKLKYGGWIDKNNGNVNLCIEYMRHIHRNIDKYIEYLINAGVLETDGTHRVGEKCRGYRFVEQYRGQPLKRIEIKSLKVKNCIRRLRKALVEDRKKELFGYGHILKWYYSGGLKIDATAALAWIDEYYNLNHAAISNRRTKRGNIAEDIHSLTDVCNSLKMYVVKLNAGVFEPIDFTVCSFGHRLHGVFTYMMKEIRNFITYNKAPLVAVDLKNSQPYFVNGLFNREFWMSEKVETKKVRLEQVGAGIYRALRQDKRLYNSIIMAVSSETFTGEGLTKEQFTELSCTGELYEFLLEEFSEKLSLHFIRKYPARIKDRNAIKREVLRIMYCLNSNVGLPYYETCRRFGLLFPIVSKLLYAIKENNVEVEPHISRKKPILKNRTLAAILQRIESNLLLCVICRRIAKERPGLPIFTIHDSIVTTVGNEEYVKSIIMEELEEKIGVAPNVQYEYWKQEKAYPVPVNEQIEYICEDDIMEE